MMKLSIFTLLSCQRTSGSCSDKRVCLVIGLESNGSRTQLPETCLCLLGCSLLRDYSQVYFGGVKGSGCRNSRATISSTTSSAMWLVSMWDETHLLHNRTPGPNAENCCDRLKERGRGVRRERERKEKRVGRRKESSKQVHCVYLQLRPSAVMHRLFRLLFQY